MLKFVGFLEFSRKSWDCAEENVWFQERLLVFPPVAVDFSIARKALHTL